MKNSIFIKYLLLAFALLCLTTNSIQSKENQLTILRLDKDLLEYINNPSEAKSKQLIEKYPTLLPALSQTISNTSSQENIFKNLLDYFSHPALKKIYNDAVNKFFSAEQYEKELSAMVLIAKEELQTSKIPQFSFHVSGFKENSIYTTNNIVSLSIDKYLGKDYPAYKGYFRTFQLQQMDPKMVSRDLTKAWLMADYIKTESTDGDLLSEMIEQGKLLYTLSKLLPNFTEHDLIGYTDQEYNWCTNNHKKIWNSIVKQNHLYTTDRHTINRYFDEISEPKTGIKGSPVKIGSWIGFQIVKQYAETTKKPLKTILSTEARSMLRDAKYKQ